MKNDWMLDVIADLHRFADMNGMDRLSDQLARTARIASEELAGAVPSAARCPAGGKGGSTGSLVRAVIACRDA